MRILDTVVLVASSDPSNKLHVKATRHLKSLKTRNDVYVPSVVLFEYDTLLKSRGISTKDRKRIFDDLSLIISLEKILPNNPSIHSEATRYDKKDFYFDSLVASTALEHGATIVSTDSIFDTWKFSRMW